MADAQEAAQRLAEELEDRGARAVDVQGDLAVDAFDSTNDGQGSRLFGHDAEIQACYDGDPEWVRNAAAEVQGVQVQRVDEQPYMDGTTRVSADIVLLEGGSPGVHPGGHADTSPPKHPNSRCGTSPVEPPPEAEQDPHVKPGGTWSIEDENGFADGCEVAFWPVRVWKPPGGVPAVSVLRYVPAPRAHGLEWWGGYVRLAEDPPAPSSGLFQKALRRLRAEGVEWRDVEVPISYYDAQGWVGWTACDLPVEVAGIPVFSSVATEVAEMDHQEAGDVTREYSEAALRVRREVLG